MIGVEMLGALVLVTVAVLPGAGLSIGFMDWTIRRGWHAAPIMVGSLFIVLAYCVALTMLLAKFGLATL